MQPLNVIVTHEDLRGVENARAALNKLVDADIEIAEYGMPPLALVVDDLDSLLSKIRAQNAERDGVHSFPRPDTFRVLSLEGGRLT